MAPETRLVETFNTHKMKDDVILALATGRDDELTDIMTAIRDAAERPDRAPPALITYGERGSGKSFMMRLVQLGCADVPGVACALLPEEHDNIRTPQKILQVVASQIRGESRSETAWKFDARDDDTAWAEELAGLHAALDARFGAGKGLAVVLLENIDILFLHLFGATAPSGRKANKAAQARRLAEERLRKLMTAPGGRFMLVASATGTVDMDYERPLFMAFRTVDLQPWRAETAIAYYNKRRELQGLPALDPAEQARAEAVTEFTGGNARLIQLLGEALSIPDLQDIAAIFDGLVDKLSDYYRERIKALPPAATGVLNALIHGGDPVTQSGLAKRVEATQPQIADAFNYLVRSRLVQAGPGAKPGGGQLYKVRDRLFVHFYRRRYGDASTLVAIAELLESVLTPDEREAEIRSRLNTGDLRDLPAFGYLPLSPHVRATGYCPFREFGITDGPDHYAFALSGAAPEDIPALRSMFRDAPPEAYRYWSKRAAESSTPLQQAASAVLAAKAASRMKQDVIAERDLKEAVNRARSCGDPEALIVALDTYASLTRLRMVTRSNRETLLNFYSEPASLGAEASNPAVLGVALHAKCICTYWTEDYEGCAASSLQGLEIAGMPPGHRLRFLFNLACAKRELKDFDAVTAIADELYNQARAHTSIEYQIDALIFRANNSSERELYEDALRDQELAADLAEQLDNIPQQASCITSIAHILRVMKNPQGARVAAKQALDIALKLEPPEITQAARANMIIGQTLMDEAPAKNAPLAIAYFVEALRQAADGEGGDLMFDALDELIFAGTVAPSKAPLEGLRECLKTNPAAVFAEDLNTARNWPWVVAKANAWPEAVRLAEDFPELLARAPAGVWSAVMRETAKLWTRTAKKQDRAAAYAQASEALPAMQRIWSLARTSTSDQFLFLTVETVWRSLINHLTAECRDPGLLRDLADLFDHVAGNAVVAQTANLRAFANLYDAPDKEAYLRQADPDLAVTMRRTLNLEEPPALPDKGRRKRSR